MAKDISIQGGHRLDDVEASSDGLVDDHHADMRRQLLPVQREQSQTRQSTYMHDPREEMATQCLEQPDTALHINTPSRHPSVIPGQVKQSNNTGSSPVVIDDSPNHAPRSQLRAHKRPSSFSLTPNGPSKRQQTRHNTPMKISPSRAPSHGPVNSLFSADMDIDEQQGYLGDRERSDIEDKYAEGHVHRSRTRAEHERAQSRRNSVSLPNSARYTPSHERVSPARPTLPRDHRSSSHHSRSNEYSTQLHLTHSSQRRNSPRDSYLPKDFSRYQSGERMAKHSSRQSRDMSPSSRQDHQKFQDELSSEDNNMEEDGFTIVRDPLAYQASLMRKAVRSQSLPPQQGFTVPPESLREQAQYEHIGNRNGGRPVSNTSPKHKNPNQNEKSRGICTHHIEHEQHVSRSASRQQSLRPGNPPKKYVLDDLEASSEESSDEDDIKKLLASSRRHRTEQNSLQQSYHHPDRSPLQFNRTAISELFQSVNHRNRPKTPTPQCQSSSSQYFVKSLHLDSPIWGPGAGQRVITSISRPLTPQRHDNGIIHGFPDEKRGRSRSRTLRRPGNETVNGFRNEQRSRSRSNAPRTPHRRPDGSSGEDLIEQRGRGRSGAPRTPAFDRVRGQSQRRTPNQSIRAISQAYEFNRAQSLQCKSQNPQDQNCPSFANNRRDSLAEGEVIETPQAGQRFTTPRVIDKKPHSKVVLNNNSEDEFYIPMDKLIRNKQQEAINSFSIQNAQTNPQKVSGVLPSGSAFDKVKSKPQKMLKPEPATPKSGRGLGEVIDLCTPETVCRSVPMNKRLPPTAKQLPLKKTAAQLIAHVKPVKIAAQLKRTPKEKAAPVDPNEIRQKRAAEMIIDREQKSDQYTLDLALFGEIVRDQAAEDKRAEDARAKGQREREAKMAAILAKEETALRANEAEQKLKQDEAERRKREKEAEEEQKKAKREADRNRQQAHDKRERELLRQASMELIKAERDKRAKEDERREFEKQKAKELAESIQANAEDLAKLKAKQEQAKLQAASLISAKKIAAAPSLKSIEEVDELFDEDEDTLFVPEVPLAVPDKSDTGEQPTAKYSSSHISAIQGSSLNAIRAEMEHEGTLKKLESARKIQAILAARYNKGPSATASITASFPNPRPQQAAPRPKPANKPVPDAEKPVNTLVPKPAIVKPAPLTAPAPKQNPLEPASKSQPLKQQKITRDMMSDSSRSQSSSTSRESAPPLTYLQQQVAKPMFPGMPSSYSECARNQAKVDGDKPREYKHKVKLISDIERERLEKAHIKKRFRVRDNRKSTEQQKQKAAEKRTELAKTKKIEQIREAAEKKGEAISEEDIDLQVKAFLEKRAQDLQKRSETIARRAQDPGHSFGRNPLSAENIPTAAQQLLCDSDQNDGLDQQLGQQQRDNQAARRARGTIRNNAFDKAAARKSVNDLTDSEESEEDPDPEPEVEGKAEGENSQQQKSILNGEAECLSDVESSSESESEDDSESMTSFEMSASFMSIAAENDLRVRKKRIDALGLGSLVPKEGSYHERMTMIYEVWKLEITNANDQVEETKREEHVVAKFATLEEANACAIDAVRDLLGKCEYAKFVSSYKDGKYSAAAALDANHECQIYIVEEPVGPSELSPEFIATIPKRKPECFWDVFQYTTLRDVKEVNEETGETIIHKSSPEPARYGQFAVLDMANHEACEKLISLFRPVGANMDHIARYKEVMAMAREARDSLNADGICFDVEVEEDSISTWMPYKHVQLVVERVELKGPLN
ncbi:uncharacterized protein RCO7_11284 [Rhynchosporium graminicola]|uniref:Uncharacterized protein n=1 Tax=Rhynchosporium graminicola TaxID=2792576 RepID=A0A1E1LU88_9HELO|nr:uncharacterized protein RCO7_11284 [Rhynchosporium commune]